MNNRYSPLLVCLSLHALALHATPCVKTIKTGQGPIHGMCLTHDNQTIITTGQDNTIKTWDIHTGLQLQTLYGHTDHIYDVCTSINDQTLFSASHSSIKIWDLYAGSCIGTLTKHKGPIYCLCISPDDEHLYSGNGQGSIMEWDIQEGYAARVFYGHEDAIQSMCINQQATHLISTAADRRMKVWDLKKGTCIATLGNDLKDDLLACCITSDGHTVYCAGALGTITQYDLIKQELIKKKDTPLISINAICLTPDNRLLISASNEMTIDLWNAKTLDHIMTLKGHNHWVKKVNVFDDGKKIISSAFDGTIKIWRITGLYWYWFYYLSKIGL